MGKWRKRTLHGTIAIVLVAMGLMGFMKLSSGKPKIKRTRPKKPLPVVEVMIAKKSRHQVIVRGYGNVRAAEIIRLVSEVAGKVIYVSPSLVEGGSFDRDELLVKIDPAHYQVAVTLARAKVKEAESKVAILEAEARQAREEWKLTRGDTIEELPPPLVLKEPQLMAARAALKAARAQLEKALLDLERTELRAPFKGMVKEEDVGIGQYVAKGQTLATLYGTEIAEVVVPLEREELRWLEVPGFTIPHKAKGSKAFVRVRIGKDVFSWEGWIARAGAQVDEKTREVRVIVIVNGPYQHVPPLISGLFVGVELMGPELSGIIRVPRCALLPNDKVWVVDNAGLLRLKDVKVSRLEAKWALVERGIEVGQRVVISPLKVMTQGMEVRTRIRDMST